MFQRFLRKRAGKHGAENAVGRLRRFQTYIQWKYFSEGDDAWLNLIAQSDITGAVGANGENGANGITPQLRVNSETNMLEVSYDSGANWTALGVKATGAAGQANIKNSRK